MPRGRKKALDTAAPPDKIEGKAGPAAPDPRLISTLDARAQALAQAQKQRKRMSIDVPPPMYERILTLAERWDEPLMVVMRAALESGLSQLIEFPGDPRRSPFTAGATAPRTPGQIDPVGNQFPPPPVTLRSQLYAPLPPPVEYVEPVWSPPPPIGLPPGLLPSSGYGAPPKAEAWEYTPPVVAEPALLTHDAPVEETGIFPIEQYTTGEVIPDITTYMGSLLAASEVQIQQLDEYKDEVERQQQTVWKDPFADDDEKIAAAIAEASQPDDELAGLL